MRTGVGAAHRLETSLRIDPRVVLASRLLQLSQGDLEQAVDAELAENPALERLEDEASPVTREEILRSVAPGELRSRDEDYELRRSSPGDEAPPDWTDLAAAPTRLSDHLRAQLLPGLAPELRALGGYVIDSLDDRGYFAEPPEEIALATGRSIEEVEEVVRRLHRCEPAGVGARDPIECLLLQLRDAQGIERRLARSILRSHLDEFLARRTIRLARRYRVMPEVVERAFDEIAALSPYPAQGFGDAGFGRAPRACGVRPDLVLRRCEQGWSVEAPGPDPAGLVVSRAYRRRARELAAMERAPRDERRHVAHFVQRANDFVSCLEQRRQTLRKIGEYLIERQSGFVSTGRYEFLRPLTRSQVAADLGMHESTVSRATADKFVQLPSGEIAPFEVFFKPALRVQKMIQEILATENPDAPLTDERIAEMLAERGVAVARRTVNKYRDRTKLLSSRKRRSA